jgi:hypothetical protein
VISESLTGVITAQVDISFNRCKGIASAIWAQMIASRAPMQPLGRKWSWLGNGTRGSRN